MQYRTRRFVVIILVLSCISLSGCSQIVREGIREGALIDSKTECKQCVISSEIKMEFISSSVPSKVRVFKEVTYGDTIKNKHKTVGYKITGNPPAGSTVYTKIISIPISLGLVLLFPQYYSDPVTKCEYGPNSKCTYETEEWNIDNEYQYSASHDNISLKIEEFSEPVTVALYEIEPVKTNTINGNSNKKKKSNKNKTNSLNDTKTNNIRNYSEPVVKQIYYPNNSVIKVDLCQLRGKSTFSGDYRIIYDIGEKKLESTFKSWTLYNICQEALPATVNNDFVEMPTPPE